METHMRKHNGEKFCCDVPECKFVTHAPKLLTNHKKNLHAEKKFKCEFCSYGSNGLAEMENHVRQQVSMIEPVRSVISLNIPK